MLAEQADAVERAARDGQIVHPRAQACARAYNFGMHRLRKYRLPYGWAALAAFLFGLFMPVAAHAIGADQPRTITLEVCSAMGTKSMLMVIDGGVEDAGKAMQDMTHCDLCCPQHHFPFAPPRQPDFTPALDGGRAAYPPLFYHAPTPQFAWSPLQSRGPPFLRS